MKQWLSLLLLITTCGLTRASDENARAAGELLFVRRLVPLLQSKCLGCHGADESKREGELDLSSDEGFKRGGASGKPLIVSKAVGSSPLILAVGRASSEWSAMPPKEAERLTAEQVEWLREWIGAGSPWPDAQRQAAIAKQNAEAWEREDGVTLKSSGGLSPDWDNRKYKAESLWAYQPLKRVTLPIDQRATHAAKSPIDQLIESRLPPSLQTAPSAERITLIRRVTFDLVGLPPTPEDVRAFVDDPLDDAHALEKVVERLLSSPHYGERMAQHWLDVVRYADSSGFANDYERGSAWRYRDYVVRSFNRDEPFDQFVREQIAGDEIAPNDPEAIIATGFLRMGPWELTGMEVAKVARQRFLDDVTNSVGESFLAHSLQCARCHDHKFDPIPTRDYYAIQAVFANTQLAERPAPFLEAERRAGFDERQYLETRRREHQATLEELDEVLLRNAEVWLKQQGVDAAPWHAAVSQARSGNGKEVSKEGSTESGKGNTKVANKGATKGNRGTGRRAIFETARGILLKEGLSEDLFPPKLVGFTPQQFGMERVARKGLERLTWELERYEPFALAVYNGATPTVKSVNAPMRMPIEIAKIADLEETCILAGGDPFSPTAKVAPGVLSVIDHQPNAQIPSALDGRRRALAEWLASEKNPLTARVIANRIWQWHFNVPLAGNPNNFGATGQPPSHPELLDWLATALIEDGWSIKALHRRILSSEAYRRSSDHPAPKQLAEKDPLGKSYAAYTPRRLSAEELRDAMLAVSGELNPAVGGIPCRPKINSEVALQPRQVMGTFAAAWTPNPKPEDRNRRSLYVLKLRGLMDPMLEIFNAPSPDFSCERRDTSTVTPQVFSLFNSEQSHARALALAARAFEHSDSDQRAIQHCFELLYARAASPNEVEVCLSHWRETEAALPAEPKPDPELPLSITREAVEENTGERFIFKELLPAHADFVPDLQAADVQRHVRALADTCLALLNSSEFVYVY